MDGHNSDYDCNDLPHLKVATGLGDLNHDAATGYWIKLERTLYDVFHETDAQTIVGDYQKRLQNAGTDAQFLAYHIDPLQVAADLTGNDVVTLEQKISYLEILKQFSNSPNELPDDNALDYN